MDSLKPESTFWRNKISIFLTFLIEVGWLLHLAFQASENWWLWSVERCREAKTKKCDEIPAHHVIIVNDQYLLDSPNWQPEWLSNGIIHANRRYWEHGGVCSHTPRLQRKGMTTCYSLPVRCKEGQGTWSISSVHTCSSAGVKIQRLKRTLPVRGNCEIWSLIRLLQICGQRTGLRCQRRIQDDMCKFLEEHWNSVSLSWCTRMMAQRIRQWLSQMQGSNKDIHSAMATVEVVQSPVAATFMHETLLSSIFKWYIQAAS
jgi:hypothetical protein